jgi:hypothetical protein
MPRSTEANSAMGRSKAIPAILAGIVLQRLPFFRPPFRRLPPARPPFLLSLAEREERQGSILVDFCAPISWLISGNPSPPGPAPVPFPTRPATRNFRPV